MRSGHTGWAGADDCDLFSVRLPRSARENVDGVAGLRAVAFGHKSLQRPDGNWQVKLSAATSRFTRMTANSAADGREGIGDPGITVGFFVPSLRDQRYVPPGLGVDGTGLHAGKGRFQPFQIDEFCASRHLDAPVPWSFYFFTVRSAVAPPAVTSTACVVTLPSSLQVFRVYLPGGTFLIS